jgi:hypothetical protein
METSESIKEIATALCKFQSEVDKIKKTEENSFFKSKYADLSAILDVIRKPLSDNNLSFVQFPTEKHQLCTMLMHTSGEWMRATYEMTPTKNDPQGLGSVITYQRRYALGAILGLNIDNDDDGNAASTPAQTKAVPAQTKAGPAQTEKKWLNPNTPQWSDAVKYVANGGLISEIEKKYRISKENQQKIINESIEGV